MKNDRLEPVLAEPIQQMLRARPVEDAGDPHPVRRPRRNIDDGRGVIVQTQLVHEILGIFAHVECTNLDMVAACRRGAARRDNSRRQRRGGGYGRRRFGRRSDGW